MIHLSINFLVANLNLVWDIPDKYNTALRMHKQILYWANANYCNLNPTTI